MIKLRELKLPSNFPKHCKTCIHYAKEVKYFDKYIKGNFCARIIDWSDKCKQDGALLNPCSGYERRDSKVITYLRECAPFVIDMEHFF